MFFAGYISESRRQFSVYEKRLKDCFTSKGVDLNISALSMERGKLEKWMIGARPHFLFYDIFKADDSASKRKIESFLELISELRGRFPETVFVAMSRDFFDIQQFGVYFPNPDFVVSKLQLDEMDGKLSAYAAYITDSIWKLNRRAAIRSIEITHDETIYAYEKHSGFQKKILFTPRNAESKSIVDVPILAQLTGILNKVSVRDIDSVVSELFVLLEGVCFDAAGAETAWQIDDVHLSLMSGGYSGAVVFSRNVETHVLRTWSEG